MASNCSFAPTGPNKCASKPSVSSVAAGVTRLQYTDCGDVASMVLYTIRGEGHQWPGGRSIAEQWLLGSYSGSIDATQLMWAFFREHRAPNHLGRDAQGECQTRAVTATDDF